MSKLDELKKFLESEEGKESIRRFAEKLNREHDILNSQLDRFHAKWENKFPEAVDIVLKKYRSKEYRISEYKKGYEPREPLMSFLFEYSKKYGRECTAREWALHSNSFTSDLRYIQGKYVGLCVGQGAYIFIE